MVQPACPGRYGRQPAGRQGPLLAQLEDVDDGASLARLRARRRATGCRSVTGCPIQPNSEEKFSVKATEDRLRALMMQGLNGDAASHGRTLSELSVLLRGYYSRRFGGDPSDEEALVQETLIAVHTRRESYDPGKPSSRPGRFQWRATR